MKEDALSDDQVFMVNQIQNTIIIVKTFSNDNSLSFTALLNALLSLVLLPFESVKKKDGTKLWQGSYKDFGKKIGFTEMTFKPIAECRDGEVKFNKRTQYSFIKKFRNAIAHQNIYINIINKKIETVEFFNIFPSKCGSCSNVECSARENWQGSRGLEDFRVSFTYIQLQDFAYHIAESFMRSITGKVIEEGKVFC